MAFEVVVRPVVFPNIRPQTPQILPQQTDSTQGFATLNGNPAQSASGSYSYTSSTSNTRRQEKNRLVDNMRVYQKLDKEDQKEGEDNVNKDNYIDMYFAKRITMFGDSRNANNSFGGGRLQEKYGYQKQKEEDNIELREENKLIEPEDAPKPPLFSGTVVLTDPDAAQDRVKVVQQQLDQTIAGLATKVTFKLKSMAGEFSTDFQLQVTDLKIPMGYNLEAT
jgi:hypothetical protein